MCNPQILLVHALPAVYLDYGMHRKKIEASTAEILFEKATGITGEFFGDRDMQPDRKILLGNHTEVIR